MSYRIEWARSAIRELEALPEASGIRVARSVRALADDPRPRGCKKLRGYRDLWRIRIGNYRVIYLIADTIRLVRIERVADRKDAY